MRFDVPQFIEIEDKVFGPFTWRQFIYLGGGIGMGVVLFLTTPFWVFVLLGIPLGSFALALAFYQVNNRRLEYFLEAMFLYFSQARLYLWRRRGEVMYTAAPNHSEEDLLLKDIPASHRPRLSITSLARSLEMQALQKKE